MIADHHTRGCASADQSALLLSPCRANRANELPVSVAALATTMGTGVLAAEPRTESLRRRSHGDGARDITGAPDVCGAAAVPGRISRDRSHPRPSGGWTSYFDTSAIRSFGHAVLSAASAVDRTLLNSRKTSSSLSSFTSVVDKSASERQAHRRERRKSSATTRQEQQQQQEPRADASVTSPTSSKGRSVLQQQQREEALRRRIASWDVAAAPLPIVADDNRATATATAERLGCVNGVVEVDRDAEEPQRSSGSSSPSLSTSSGSARSSASPSPPSLQVGASAASESLAFPPSLDVATALPEQGGAALAGRASACRSPPLATFEPVLSTPPRFTMAEVVRELRRVPREQHPFLDMQQQRQMLEQTRSQEHLNAHVVKAFQQQLSEEQQSAALKCLLNGAHRLQHRQCSERQTGDVRSSSSRRAGPVAAVASAAAAAAAAAEEIESGARAPSGLGRWGPRQLRLVQRQWRVIAELAECDMYREGSASVQRKLSCICLFNPDVDIRVYHDCSTLREQRCLRQQQLLTRLQQQRFRGGNAYFLEL